MTEREIAGRNINADAMNYFTCSTCGAKPREHCHTIKGGWDYSGTWYVHEARKAILSYWLYQGVNYGRRLTVA